MDNQHKKISGYRDLSQQEIDGMNALKKTEQELLGQLDAVGQLEDIDNRWLAIGRTHIEQGFMAAVRAIARPNT